MVSGARSGLKIQGILENLEDLRHITEVAQMPLLASFHHLWAALHLMPFEDPFDTALGMSDAGLSRLQQTLNQPLCG